MANSILSNLVSQASFKLYDSNGFSVFTGIKVEEVNVEMPGRLLKNIDELGRAIVDTKIVLPITVTVSAYADTNQALAKINTVLGNTTERFTIYSRGLYFKGLTLADENISQTEEMLSATPVNITFRGIMFQGDGAVVTSQAGDASTVLGGIVSTVSTAASKISSIASKFFG